MKTGSTKEVGCALLGMGFSIYVAFESWRLGIGTFSAPGPGFLPLGAALLIGIFSLAGLWVFRPLGTAEEVQGGRWNIVLVVVALVVFAWLVERLGFLLTTTLFLVFLLRVVQRKRWPLALVLSFLIAAASYGVFQIWLRAQLPKGLLGI